MLKAIKRGFTLVELAITAGVLAGLVFAIFAAVDSARGVAETNVGGAEANIASLAGITFPALTTAQILG